jgi:hypothetical protein
VLRQKQAHITEAAILFMLQNESKIAVRILADEFIHGLKHGLVLLKLTVSGPNSPPGQWCGTKPLAKLRK